MKALKTVAVIAGAVALVATGIGAAAGAGLLGAGAMGAGGVVAGIGVGTIATIASVATVVATAASIGAALLYKEPQARAAGSMNQIVVEREAPRPYMIGRTYSAGVLRYDVGFGATQNEVPNPFRAMYVVHSGVGPVDHVESHQVDYEPVDFTTGAAGYYAGFLWRDWRAGAMPDTAIDVSQPVPDWGPDYKLSGHFATGWMMKFDRDGKRFASGVPRLGVVARGVRVYDPRQDATYPGGAGDCRALVEGSYVYRDDPATHALTYALGRFANGKRVFGIGIAAAALVMADFVAFANVCDANGWKTGGIIYEPADRWGNLKDILAAGGAEPVWKGARLGLKWSAPHVSVGRIDVDDLADDDTEIEACRSYSVRLNGRVPKYRSEEHQWEYVSAGEVVVDAYVAEDGEKKVEERQWNLVQDKDQVSQLAAYDLVNRRELGPIEVVCKPHMRSYRAGDCLTVDLPQLGLVEQDCLILQRTIDPATLKVHFTLETETVAKHDFALGRTGTPPPTPRLVDSEQRDIIAGAVITTTWSGLIDDDGNKPEDGATVGATAAELALLSAALSSAENAQATADGKIETFYQDNEPTGTIGDLWFDTNDGYKLYRRNVGGWALARDRGIGDAITAAAGAQATADGKVTTFSGEGTPTAEGVGDLWYKPSDGSFRRWDGDSWDVVSTVGAPVGTKIGDKQVATVLSDILANAQNTADLSGVVGAYRIANDNLTHAADGTTVKYQTEQIGIKASDLDLFVKNMVEIDPVNGTAKAINIVNANGIIVGQEFMAGPGGGIAGWMADIFVFFDSNGGNPIQVMRYEDGVWKMGSIEVDTVKVRSINADHIVANGITETYEASNATGGPLGSMTDWVIYPVVMEKAGSLILMAEYQLPMSTGNTYALEIKVNGDVLKTGTGGDKSGSYPKLSRSINVGQGTYYCAARAAGSGISVSSEAISLIVMRTYA